MGGQSYLYRFKAELAKGTYIKKVRAEPLFIFSNYIRNCNPINRILKNTGTVTWKSVIVLHGAVLIAVWKRKVLPYKTMILRTKNNLHNQNRLCLLRNSQRSDTYCQTCKLS